VLTAVANQAGVALQRVRDSARAIRNADGQVLYYEGSLEDITKRKRTD
jgi:PAS domain-containing protein